MLTMAILTLETKQYAIKIDKFEGPLDLLCHLIDVNKMDIYDININQITDQYIKYLNEMEKMNLEIASEFLVMASTLLYLKSKKLLPKQDEEQEELTEEELIQRIIDYKKYKEISKTLKPPPQERGLFHRQNMRLPVIFHKNGVSTPPEFLHAQARFFLYVCEYLQYNFNIQGIGGIF